MKKKAIVMVLLSALLLMVMAGCGGSSAGQSSSQKSDDTSASAAAQQSASKSAGAEASKLSEDPIASLSEKVLSGERVYSGTSSADNMGSISVGFILSEDKGSIHDFVVAVKDFKGTAKTAKATVTVEVAGQTQTVQGDISVNYNGDNQGIDVVDNTIESLRFSDDGTAEMTLTYRFKKSGADGYEIPVPGITFKLTSVQA